MKKTVGKIVLIALMAMFTSTLTYSQANPPNPPTHDQPGNQDAPIGGGMAILLALSALYGAKKAYFKKK